MEFTLLIEYLIFAFLNSFAVLQIVATKKNKERIRLFRSRGLTISAALLLMVISSPVVGKVTGIAQDLLLRAQVIC